MRGQRVLVVGSLLLIIWVAIASVSRGVDRNSDRFEGVALAPSHRVDDQAAEQTPARPPVQARPRAITRLAPITDFIPPIEPWTPAGPGWGEPAVRADGTPMCETNHVPARACDPQGPRPFLHVGVDMMPAADRTVRASATGRVVVARAVTAAFVGRRAAEAGGVVILEHDLDGDPETLDDVLHTVYGHVVPGVSEGQVVQQGDVIARTSVVGGNHLHFGVRRSALDPADPVAYHGALPPPGTNGCMPCYSRMVPLPPFPEHWEDPDRLFGAPQWAVLLKSGQRQEGAGDALETEDGYVVAGWTHAANIGGKGALDAWIARLDVEGRIVSQHAYGGDRLDAIHRLAPTPDGGFVALAQSASFVATGQAPVLLKFGPASDRPQWQKMYVGSGGDWAEDVRTTADGGYVISGVTEQCAGLEKTRCAAVMKLDAAGDVRWARSFRGIGSDETVGATSIAEAADGGFVVVASVFRTMLRISGASVFRLDVNGNVMWSQIRRMEFGDASVRQIQATTDGGFIIVGSVDVYGRSLWLLKIDGDGTIEWEAGYNASQRGERGTRVIVRPEGGYVVAGWTLTGVDEVRGHALYDLWVMTLDSDGGILHQRLFDGRSPFESAAGLRSTRDGGIIMVGTEGEPCVRCDPYPSPRGVLVVKAAADLEVSNGCGTDTDHFRAPISTFRLLLPLQVVDRAVTTVPVDMAMITTDARGHACKAGHYGPPPEIRSVASEFSVRQAQCDVTRTMELQLCDLGLPGVTATMPIVLGVTYDSLAINANVTDRDSDADRLDIDTVEARIRREGEFRYDPYLSLRDDGSAIVEVVDQVSPRWTGKACFYDPDLGLCGCDPARYPAYSGDAAAGDGLYTREIGVYTPATPFDGIDCFVEASGRNRLFASAGIETELRVRATDLQGNITTWPEPIQVTPGTGSFACSGDECGCCILLHPTDYPSVCGGRRGLTSPVYPQGLCNLFF